MLLTPDLVKTCTVFFASQLSPFLHVFSFCKETSLHSPKDNVWVGFQERLRPHVVVDLPGSSPLNHKFIFICSREQSLVLLRLFTLQNSKANVLLLLLLTPDTQVEELYFFAIILSALLKVIKSVGFKQDSPLFWVKFLSKYPAAVLEGCTFTPRCLFLEQQCLSAACFGDIPRDL